ncbi:GGDEF domain-containing protein [Frigidibacter sp. MR17.14]|uniref:GGDEF domain-containing protein n=1 Tax=Frigidibacter sp. MR17.14 TaxID=3126509 RepID=UPI003013117A
MPGRVLLHDPSTSRRILLGAQLAAAGHVPLRAASPPEAAELARRAAPDLALVSLDEPEAGVALIGALARGPGAIPVLALAAAPPPPGLRLAALAAGAEDILEPLPEVVELAARIRHLTARRADAAELAASRDACRSLGLAEAAAGFEPPWSLCILGTATGGDERAERTFLTGLGRRLPARLDRASAEAALSGRIGAPDAVLVCLAPGTGPGALQLLSELRCQPALRRAAICLGLPARTGAATVAAALDLGAAEVLPLDAPPEEAGLRLARAIGRKRQADRVRAAIDEGIRQSVTDPLTGLYNRRFALPELDRIAAAARHRRQSFGLIIADIDRFKAVNDRFGHGGGDAVLAEIARRLAAELGPGDLLARIGGEEFLVVLPGRGPAEAAAVAERLRRAIERCSVRLPQAAPVAVTLSLGLAALDEAATTRTDAAVRALALADAALMRAKAEGRNRVWLDVTLAGSSLRDEATPVREGWLTPGRLTLRRPAV